MEEPFAPLREGTEATIRLTSLSGIANRYIALAMGPGDAPELDDGAVLGTNTTTSVVDLDQLFNTLDEKTRGSLQDVIKGFAAQYEGRSEEAVDGGRVLQPAAVDLAPARRRAHGGRGGADPLHHRHVDRSPARSPRSAATSPRSSGTRTRPPGPIGSENVALAEALGLLPTTLRRANTTFVNLRATLDDLDVLVAESKPATRDLAPFLRELRPLVEEAGPTIHDLRELVRRPGPDNDLVDATRSSRKGGR